MPLNGFQAKAAYYIHIMQSVQPVGPYELIGFSLGGILCYEMARQLQEMGEVVNSIVMIDTPDLDFHNKFMLRSSKNGMLTATNLTLLSSVLRPPEGVSSVTVCREELNIELTDESFFEQLCLQAQRCGLATSLTEVRNQIEQTIRVLRANADDQFCLQPLPDSMATQCHYFRNKSGLFFGHRAPNLSVESDFTDKQFDHHDYWRVWEQLLPNLRFTDVDSSCHVTMLEEPGPVAVIARYCTSIYDAAVESELVPTT